MTDSTQDVMETPDPLYLFLCCVRCLRLGDPRAYEELKRAASHANPDIRRVAEVFLAEIRAVQPQELTPVEGCMRRLTIVICILLAASTVNLADVGQDGRNKTRTYLSAPQRRQYEQCLSAIQRLETEVRALSATPSRPEPAINIYAKNRGPIRLAATSIRKCHTGFTSSLTAEQRTAMEDMLTQLSHSWSEIQRHLLTLDDDLNQHLLDHGRLMLHVQQLERVVAAYLDRYRKLGTDTAVLRRPFPQHAQASQLRFALATGETMNLAALTNQI